MRTDTLEIRRVGPELEEALADLFAALREGGDDQDFHPHTLDAAAARRIAHHDGDDLYYAVTRGNERALAYGILRGWDEGFEIPSLGIAVHPDARGSGLGRMLMSFLHAAARQRGAEHVRLTVYPGNA